MTAPADEWRCVEVSETATAQCQAVYRQGNHWSDSCLSIDAVPDVSPPELPDTLAEALAQGVPLLRLLPSLAG